MINKTMVIRLQYEAGEYCIENIPDITIRIWGSNPKPPKFPPRLKFYYLHKISTISSTLSRLLRINLIFRL